MALYSATANVTNGSDTVTVVGLVLAPSIAQPGAQVVLNGVMYFLDEIVNTTTLKIARNYAGATATGVSLEINTISESETEIVTLNQRTADLLEELLDFDPYDNLESISELQGNGVIMQDATGQHSLVPKIDLTSGIDVDARVETLAGRAAYDLRPEGFSVLVNDIGDGRAAIYYKNTNTNADWSTPAYISGPVGPTPDIEATVSMLPPGSPATVTEVPITGGVRLDFELPEADGFYNAGVYNLANTYNKDDVVRHNGSAFIALQAVPASTSPSSAFPPVDTAYWQVLAAKGADGLGTGDVVGPSGAVSGKLAAFDGATGKLILDSGVTANKVVVSNVPQSLTLAERGQARANIGAGLMAGFRNKIINGNFEIWQRGTAFAASAGGYYFADRFLKYSVGSTIAAARGLFVPGGGEVIGEPSSFANITFTAAAGASNLAMVRHRIEDVRTLAGKKATLTFYARTLTPGISIAAELTQSFGAGGSSEVTGIGVTKIALTAGFERYSIVVDIPPITGKTVGAGSVLSFICWLGAGSDFDARTGNLGHQSGAIDIARVSLVEGDATAEADPFSPRPIQQELALCQRYLEMLYNPSGRSQMTGTDVWLSGSDISGLNSFAAVARIDFKTTKRVPPTITNLIDEYGGSTTNHKFKLLDENAVVIGAGGNNVRSLFKVDDPTKPVFADAEL